MNRNNTIGRLSVFVCVLAISISGCVKKAPENELETSLRETSEPRIEEFLQGTIESEHFTGAVLVARDSVIIHAKGYGLASGDVRNSIATRFHVASITKQFTAAAVLQLVEAGALDLDGSINRYLPDNYIAQQWETVTVHHLLNHTSGIPDYAVTRDYYNVVDGFCLGDTVDGMIREAMSKDLEFEPGSKHSYSNIGFTLLGLIIENQTGAPYAQYVKEKVLDPMGMYSSKIHVEGHRPCPDEARGLRWSEIENTHIPDDIVSLPVTAPDGGLVTTLSEFLIWSQIFSGGGQKILSESSINKMTSAQIAIGRGGPLDGYGYGLYVGDRFIGHSGYIVGFRSQFIYDRETSTLIAVFTNNTTNNPQQIAFGLLTILFAPDQ